jgi:hypothetical protein
VGLALVYGRLLDAGDTSTAQRIAFIGFQYDLHRHVPGGANPRVRTGTRLPHPAQGTIFVQGDCAALFWSDGRDWYRLEGSPADGEYRFRVRFPAATTPWEPLVVNQTATGRPQFLAVRMLGRERVQFAYVGVFPGPVVRVRPGVAHVVSVEMVRDALGRATDVIAVTVDGRRAFSTAVPNDIIRDRVRRPARVSVGAAQLPGIAERFTGRIEQLAPRTPLCRKLVGHRAA